jgi:hypothetical protein
MGGIREREGTGGEIEALPYVDEHAVEVEAGADVTWEALLRVAERSFAGDAAAPFARLLGCEDPAAAGPRPLAVGSAIPGFHVALARAPGDGSSGPAELALLGRHRFSRYALTFRLDALGPDRTCLRAETRAEFPGLHGAAYRALVIGTRGHVLVTRRLLGAVKRRAERAAG